MELRQMADQAPLTVAGLDPAAFASFPCPSAELRRLEERLKDDPTWLDRILHGGARHPRSSGER